MAAKKSDIIRRSLFGVRQASSAVEQPQPTGTPQPRQTPQRKAAPVKALPLATDATAEVGLVAPAGRRAVERTAVTVPTDLLMQVKDAVAVLNGWPQQYTMARFVEEAFAAQLERLKVEHNGGRDFPVTNRKIRTGRPPGS
jgi:hypothetical protein